MNQLVLPSLKGKIGNWIYFIVTMKLSEVSEKARVSTVSEIMELYPKNINEVLQRELDRKRINKISEYLQKQDEHFLSSLIVAIFKGKPIWSEIRIEDDFKLEGKEADEKLAYARGRLGFLTLNGDEVMFVLDGQHRLKGIREAYKKTPEIVANDDVLLTFVVHEPEYKEKTRRLFTVLNRYAEKPKKAEWIIMEEDDAAAILTRRLLMTHEFFKKDNSISTTRGFAIPASDIKSFSTLVCLYDMSKELVEYKKLYPKAILIKRPSTKVLNNLYENNIIPFWIFFFKSWPKVSLFLNGGVEKGDTFLRNKQTGGSLLLRPEGQLLLAELYKYFEQKGSKDFSKFKIRIQKVNFDLSNPQWKYLFWTGERMNSKNKPLKKLFFLYLLGEKINIASLKASLNKLYLEYNDTFNLQLKPINA